MSNIGEIDEIINNEKITLKVGSDTYILLQDITLNIDRPIRRETTSGGGVVYFYGAGNNSFNFTLLASTPEIDSLNTLSKRHATTGALTSIAWKIVSQDVSGTGGSDVATIECDGTLPHMEVVRLAGVGGVLIRGRVVVEGDSLTVTLS